MKTILKVLAALGACASVVPAGRAGVVESVDLSALAGLAGCWSFERDGTRYEEWWMPPTPSDMLGMARTVKAGLPSHFEFMRIVRDAQGVAYLAYPGGKGPTRFGLASFEDSTASFENPEHDFPTQVVYAWSTGDALDARIEGMMDGKLHRIAYPFRRTPCPVAP